jgi:hypothetical protein
MATIRAQRFLEFSPRVGDPDHAQRITVNLSAEVSDELRSIAVRCSVSESSIVEIALRQLFRRVGPAALGSFLREHGGCLRRRRA